MEGEDAKPKKVGARGFREGRAEKTLYLLPSLYVLLLSFQPFKLVRENGSCDKIPQLFSKFHIGSLFEWLITEIFNG